MMNMALDWNHASLAWSFQFMTATTSKYAPHNYTVTSRVPCVGRLSWLQFKDTHLNRQAEGNDLI